MNAQFQDSSLKIQVSDRNLEARLSSAGNGRRGFSLVEIMVVIGLLSLIVVALMGVFNSTQTAFRASVTQSDVLEGGRATIDLIAQDLKQITPSGGTSNAPFAFYYFTNRDYVNFFSAANFYQNSGSNGLPLIQPLVGSIDGARRTNVLQNFFVLGRENVNGHDTWTGTGYAVDATSVDSPLYRFTMQINAASSPCSLFNTYMAALATNGFTGAGWSHLIDGVVDLRVRAYDANGYWITNYYDYDGNRFPVATNLETYNNFSTYNPFVPLTLYEANLYMFSNTVPSAVEIQLGVMEDRIQQRAESIPVLNARSNYLSQQAGAVHLFRQRVTIPSFDPSAHQ